MAARAPSTPKDGGESTMDITIRSRVRRLLCEGSTVDIDRLNSIRADLRLRAVRRKHGDLALAEIFDKIKEAALASILQHELPQEIIDLILSHIAQRYRYVNLPWKRKPPFKQLAIDNLGDSNIARLLHPSMELLLCSICRITVTHTSHASLPMLRLPRTTPFLDRIHHLYVTLPREPWLCRSSMPFDGQWLRTNLPTLRTLAFDIRFDRDIPTRAAARDFSAHWGPVVESLLATKRADLPDVTLIIRLSGHAFRLRHVLLGFRARWRGDPVSETAKIQQVMVGIHA